MNLALDPCFAPSLSVLSITFGSGPTPFPGSFLSRIGGRRVLVFSSSFISLIPYPHAILVGCGVFLGLQHKTLLNPLLVLDSRDLNPSGY